MVQLFPAASTLLLFPGISGNSFATALNKAPKCSGFRDIFKDEFLAFSNLRDLLPSSENGSEKDKLYVEQPC